MILAKPLDRLEARQHALRGRDLPRDSTSLGLLTLPWQYLVVIYFDNSVSSIHTPR